MNLRYVIWAQINGSFNRAYVVGLEVISQIMGDPSLDLIIQGSQKESTYLFNSYRGYTNATFIKVVLKETGVTTKMWSYTQNDVLKIWWCHKYIFCYLQSCPVLIKKVLFIMTEFYLATYMTHGKSMIIILLALMPKNCHPNNLVTHESVNQNKLPKGKWKLSKLTLNWPTNVALFR